MVWVSGVKQRSSMSWTLAVSSKRLGPRPGQLSQQIVGVPESAISSRVLSRPQSCSRPSTRHTFPLLVAETCVPETVFSLEEQGEGRFS